MRTVEDTLRYAPWRFTFFQAVRVLLKAMHCSCIIGRDKAGLLPVRFGSHASLAFPASDLDGVTYRPGEPAFMLVNFMGLTGPSGVLPRAWTELVLPADRGALRAFFDIFNNRMIAFFYAAWENCRSPIVLERGAHDRYLTSTLQALIGVAALSNEGAVWRQPPSHSVTTDVTWCFYAGLLSLQPRSADALERLLSHRFDVAVRVEQLVMTWRRLPRTMQTRLVSRRSSSLKLGEGVVAGDEVRDPSSLVRVHIGPLLVERYADFLPGGRSWDTLRTVLYFFSSDFEYEVRLVLDRTTIPSFTIGERGHCAPRLGWLTWMPAHSRNADVSDTILRIPPFAVIPRGDAAMGAL